MLNVLMLPNGVSTILVYLNLTEHWLPVLDSVHLLTSSVHCGENVHWPDWVTLASIDCAKLYLVHRKKPNYLVLVDCYLIVAAVELKQRQPLRQQLLLLLMDCLAIDLRLNCHWSMPIDCWWTARIHSTTSNVRPVVTMQLPLLLDKNLVMFEQPTSNDCWFVATKPKKKIITNANYTNKWYQLPVNRWSFAVPKYLPFVLWQKYVHTR